MTTLTTVKPSEIEARLEEAWNRIEGVDKVRAALFNLVVAVDDPSKTDYVLGICRLLVQRFPCRLVMLIPDESTSELTVEVAVDPIGEGDNLVSCDIIEMKYPKQDAEKVPFIVLSHLLPDLPVYLLWTAPTISEKDLFPELTQYISRILFNPDALEHLADYGDFLLSFRNQFGGDLVDLKWAYTEGWRNVIASASNSEERLGHLQRAKSATITYAVTPSDYDRDPRIQAIYLQAWLASKLGWEFHAIRQVDDKTVIEYSSGAGPLEVSLVPEKRNDRHFGAVTSVTMVTDGENRFLFTEDGPYVKCKMDNPELCTLPYAVYLPHPTQEQVLAKKVFEKGTSTHFCDVLEQISQYKR